MLKPARAVLVAALLFVRPPSPINPDLYAGLVWRNVGPFRGGRISAVTGAVGEPGTFYAGLPLGGVWKTTGAGRTWYPVFDSVKEASSVGAIEVAPSDPNVIYVGMGDLITGGGINEGNGVYKSSDAGKTWQHMGLDQTKQIPSILVDPRDPNLVLIAAQGNIHVKSGDRGVFRSTDGGKTWNRTLFVDDSTGLQKLAFAQDRPTVILATTVRHYTAPGATGRGAGGAPQTGPTGTAIYKSTDEGLTWTELNGAGLPRLTGRTCVAIAMNTNAQRMFIIGTFGLYRSDDGGANWTQMAADDRRIANGQGNYTSGVFVDPKNPDIVYTLATSSYRSLDGGKTFTGFKGAPGGDDPQVMWIDPTDGKRLFLGVDQGATISLDGGATWSSWYNQPMEQVYHISTDNQYPYWIYATQQDAGAIGTRSRGNLGEISPLDWYPVAGYEFGYIVADPNNPNIIYSGGPEAGIVKITAPSGQWINVSPNVDASAGLRKVGNQPLAFSPNNSHELLAGFQYLMSTIDGGMHWKKLSPDLGNLAGVTPAPGAPPVPAAALAGSIESFSVSSLAPGTIWVGSNNGLIHVTKNHGVTWTDVSIPDVRADVSTIDASHTSAGEAYVAIDRHAVGDYAPYFYRTRDYGKTWTKIVTGLPSDQPSGSFARVIRADTKKAGLVFAGTESSLYVSFDDGDTWQSLMQNLPNTSYRDIQIHGNDLVVGTYGRGIWILDDYSPLREISPAVAAEPVHLFKPGDAIRVRRNVNGDTPLPPEEPHAMNPPDGALIYYYLAARPTSAVTLELSDSAGHVVRHMSSAPIAPLNEPASPVPDFWLAHPQPLRTAVGTNRVNWNGRYDDPPAFTHNFAQVMGAVPGQTPSTPEGPLALPGVYTVKLTVDGKSYTQKVTVKNDPRSPATVLDVKAQHALQMKIYDGIKESWDGYGLVTELRSAIAQLKNSGTQAVTDAANAYDTKLASLGGNPNAGRGRGAGGGGRGAAGPPPPPNFAAINAGLIRQLNRLDIGDMAPNEPIRAVFATGCGELKSAVTTWKALSTTELTGLNAILKANNAAPIAAPTGALAVPTC